VNTYVNKITYIARVSKIGEKLYIVIPKKYHSLVQHGKAYRVTIEGPLD
jgi:hypothetical protein